MYLSKSWSIFNKIENEEEHTTFKNYAFEIIVNISHNLRGAVCSWFVGAVTVIVHRHFSLRSIDFFQNERLKVESSEQLKM